MSQGLCRKRKLWSVKGRAELQGLALLPWASRRRKELLAWLDQLDGAIGPLDRAVEQEAQTRPEAVLLMTHPGVGPVVSLTFVLTVGPVGRFLNSGKLVSYLGLNPSEHSSGGRQHLGAISKQGNAMMRWLLVEAAQTAAWQDEELHRAYLRLKFRRASGVAKVAIARGLAVRLYWMLRERRITRSWFACPVARVARWSRKQRDRRSDWAPGLPVRGGEIEGRIMVPEGIASMSSGA